MNRTYRLVWNRTLRIVQVASELARSPGGGNASTVDSRRIGRRHPLAQACAAVFALTIAGMALPAVAAKCVPDAKQICGTDGNPGIPGIPIGPGVNGTNGAAGGNGGAGTAYTSGQTGSNTFSITGGTGGIGGSGGDGFPGAFLGYDKVGNGGTGSSGGYGGHGGNGGTGIGGASFTFANYAGGSITGGNGNNGGNGGSGASGGPGHRGGLPGDDGGIYINGGRGGNAGGAGGAGAGGGGGAGVSGTNFGLTNGGNITGGDGGDGGRGGDGGSGGDGGEGMPFAGSDPDTASGNGGAGGFFRSSAAGAAAGNGGAGVSGIGFTLTNSKRIIGGNGGNGGSGGSGGNGGNGGNGANGVPSGPFATGSYPGKGGNGKDGGSGGNGRAGGDGGAGVSGNNFTATNSGSITGGSAGNGGNGSIGGKGGNGGKGGESFATGAPNGDDGDGGNGGNGGNGGKGGRGAAGVSGHSFMLTNSGSITGGNGGVHGVGAPGGVFGIGGDGTVGSLGNFGSNGTDGPGGVGIISTRNGTVINSGSISGGLASDGKTRGNAVEFSGGANTLTLERGYSVIGHVVSTSGSSTSGDTLALGGTQDASFDTSRIGASAQYRGFAHLNKSGTSRWTLTGVGTDQTWRLLAGTLQLGDGTHVASLSGDQVAIAASNATTVDVKNTAKLLGGSGSSGSAGTASNPNGSNGDSGGLAISGDAGSRSGNGFTLINGGTVAGGRGGDGGANAGLGGGGGNGGNGGNGGSAADGIGYTFDNRGATSGGNGGDGGDDGGNGAVALNGSFFTVSNGGTISGGNGGNAGGGVLVQIGNNGGSGGAAITGSAFAISNTGTIRGGNGGNAGNGITPGIAGAGGIGIESDNNSSITTSGQIIGGLSADGSTRAAAVTFTGTGNTLTLERGFSISGNVISSIGTLTTRTVNTLALGGSSDSSFDASLIGSTAQYQQFRAFEKTGSSTWTLTGTANDATGWVISAGTLRGDTSSLRGTLTDNATLVFDQSTDGSFAGSIRGSGTVIKRGSGTVILNVSNSYTGGTTVQAGKLVVGGNEAHADATIAGDVAVANTATLGGHGSIGGSVTLAAGAHLAPGNSIGTLTVAGDFTAAQGSVLDYQFGAPTAAPNTFNAFGSGDRVTVGGNLGLNGATLNVSDAGGFGPGLYNLFTYGGTLTENNGGITLGTTPGGNYAIQTLTDDKQINLLSAGDTTLYFWNGNGLATPTTSGGGNGTWSNAAQVWTDATGSTALAMQPLPGFAIFGGAPGTVTVDSSDGAVSATGMQFTSDGYTLTGATLSLVGYGSTPIIRVGANDSATISNVITGSDGLEKTDLGTLILTAENTYGGGTILSNGTLQLGDGSNAASLTGDANSATVTAGSGTSLKVMANATLHGGSGIYGLGGVGVISTGGSTITTSGGISGGLSSDNSIQADAVDFSGGGNSLTLENGYSFAGNVVSSSGSTNGGDLFALGGDSVADGGTGNGTFNLSDFVTTAPTSYSGTTQYYGFTTYEKTGSSSWTLTGSSSGQNWLLQDGTLQLGDGSNAASLTGDASSATVTAGSGTTLKVMTLATLLGGDGNDGSPGISGHVGSAGGNGGTSGAGVSGADFTLTNSGSITGGNGGDGASGGSTDVNADGGSGGDGSDGGAAVSGTGFTLVNSGSIAGGDGGNGASGGDGGDSNLPGSKGGDGGSGGDGGDGGAGVRGSGFTLTNSGSISGGNGGNGASGGQGGAGIGNSYAGATGATGAQGLGSGVVSTGDSTITNSGTISGVLGGDGVTRGDAVNFSGGGNTLTLVVGSLEIGNIVSTSGASHGGDTLILTDNSGGGSNNVANIIGFNLVDKTGSSSWTVTGNNSGTNWLLQAGSLQLGDGSNPASLTSDATGTVTASSNTTLEVMANATLAGGHGDAGTSSAAGSAGTAGSGYGGDGNENGGSGGDGGDGQDGNAGGVAINGTGFAFINGGAAIAGDGGSGGDAGSGGDGGGKSSYSRDGDGGDGGNAGGAGDGGSGGIGVSGSGFMLTHSGTLTGGNGGAGGAGGNGGNGGTGYNPVDGLHGANGGTASHGGDGGIGGAGVSAVDFTLSSSGSITGGVGGRGGIGGDAGNYGVLTPAGNGGSGGGGGAGVSGSGFTLTNSGHITGGVGNVNSRTEAAGGIGGYGSNSDAGGNGGNGGNGGIGGAGVSGTDFTLINDASGAIDGGDGGISSLGGVGGNGRYDLGSPGGLGGQAGIGGNGGTGVSGAGFTLSNNGRVTGGSGGINARSGTGGIGGASGYGGNGGASGYGGKGGAGISGVDFALSNGTSGSITGGDGSRGGGGGVGGNGTAAGGSLSHGGMGGNAANGASGGDGVGGTGFTFTNSGVITGGTGGNGGSGGGGGNGSGHYIDGWHGTGGDAGNGGNGGLGGAGVSGAGFAFTNRGSITGGTGGESGYGGTRGSGAVARGSNGDDGSYGLGGAGIASTGNSTVTSSGSISGGLTGTLPRSLGHRNQSDAVVFSGGGNSLILENGYSITGNVISSSNNAQGGDALILGGNATGPGATGNGTFDASAIVFTLPDSYSGAAQYYGFTSHAKTGTSTWTLTGTANAATPWTISAGTLQGDTNSLQGHITDNATLAFDQAIDGTFAGVISGSGALSKLGTGTVTLTGTNTYTGGTTISAGTLQGNSNSLQGDITDNATLTFDQATDGSFAGVVSGSGALSKLGTGTLTLSGANTYTGGTTISVGTLQGNTTSLQGDITDNAALVFNQTGNGTFAGAISGSGSLSKLGNGTVILDGINSYTGHTAVQAGKLAVGGDEAHADATIAGEVAVANTATLGGHGRIDGGVMLASGAHLAPGNSIGTLTVTGDFTAAQGSVLDYEFGAPGAGFSGFGQSDRTVVGGDLALNGAVLNVSDIGGFGAGTYNLFTYGGTLSESNGGISLGTTPGSIFTVQMLTSSKQVNLINTTGLTLNFWNANGLASSTSSGGGDGTWSSTAPIWTDADGNITLAMQPQPGFAIFGGTPGTVTVDNSDATVSANGLQFASDGYTVSGDTLTLVSAITGDMPIIRVGDGSSTGSHSTAIISAVIAGTDGLDKTDLGTLILTGANTYTGGTTISGGTLQGNTTSLHGDITDNAALVFDQTADGTFADVISGSGALTKISDGTLTLSGANSYSGGTTISAGILSVANDANLGDASGGLTLDGGTLQVTGTTFNSTARALAMTAQGGGFDIADASNQLTVTQALSGSGALTKLGAGTLTLTGANTYNGGTTITAGTLQVGNGGATGSISGNVTNNGTLAFNRSDAVSFAGVVSGSGSLTKLGNGTLTLTGANTYNGGTTITAGTLQGDSTSLQGDIVNNAALVFEQTASGSFAGAISGSGSLAKSGAGTLSFTGDNSYTGGTTITAGTLQVGDGGTTGSISGNVTDNGTLAFNRSDAVSFGGVVSGSGALTKLGAGTLTLTGANTYNGGTTISAGTLQGDSTSLQGDIVDNAALVFEQTATGRFAGAISGNGSLSLSGGGTLILEGNSSSFAGSTAVLDGTLEVGDEATPSAVLGGNVTVDAGGTLRGHGTIGGDVANGGTLWAGGSIGTLTVQGDYLQAANGVLKVDATPAGQASLLNVGGMASLAGSALVLADAGTWAPRTDYTILTASGGVTGQFTSASSSLLFLDPVLSYGANDVTLSLQRNDISFDTVAQTRNQTAVAVAADGLGLGNAAYTALTTLDAASARHALNQLSGVNYPGTRTALIDDSRHVRDAINRHLLGLDHDGSEGATANGVSVWTSVWGHGGHDDDNGNAATQQAHGSGLLLGADLPLGDSRLGVVLGHGQNSIRSNSVGASAHVLGNHAGLYGSGEFGAFALRAGVAYAWQDVRGNRLVAFGNYSDWLANRHHAQTAHAYVEGGYRFQASANQQLEPFVNLARVRVHEDALQEGSGAAALVIGGSSASVNVATLGLRDTLILDAAAGIHAHASLGWQQAWGDLRPVSSMRFVAGGNRFVIAGMPMAQHAVTVDLGIDFKLSKHVTVDATYLGRFADGVRDQGARMSLTVAF